MPPKLTSPKVYCVESKQYELEGPEQITKVIKSLLKMYALIKKIGPLFSLYYQQI